MKYPYQIKCPAAAILIGGQAARMQGAAKFLLKDENGHFYLEKQIGHLTCFERIYLSAANDQQLQLVLHLMTKKCRGLTDRVTDCGPLGALYSVLSQLSEEDQWVFVTACDLPELSEPMIDGLMQSAEAVNQECEAVVYQDSHGRIHPLCGLYRTTLLPVMEQMLLLQDYKMQHLLIRSHCLVVSAKEKGIPDACFANINTPEDYQQWQQQHEKHQKILCVCGVKNSGKTTYIEKLVRALTVKEKRVAVIKHDGHDFKGDCPGTDTYRFHEAGASATAVFSAYRYMINADRTINLKQLKEQFWDADIILIEGMKQSTLPKIEIVRRGVSDTLSSNRENLIAIVTDLEKDFCGFSKWPLNDCRECVAFLLEKRRNK